MQILIVEDDATSRFLLEELLAPHGTVTAVDNGPAALDCVRRSLEQGSVFNLICLDIMLPEMDGQEILKKIRQLEERAGFAIGQGSKILMTTALRDKDNILNAFRSACDGYLRKPIERKQLEEELRALSLLH